MGGRLSKLVSEGKMNLHIVWDLGYVHILSPHINPLIRMRGRTVLIV